MPEHHISITRGTVVAVPIGQILVVEAQEQQDIPNTHENLTQPEGDLSQHKTQIKLENAQEQKDNTEKEVHMPKIPQ